MCPSLPLHSSGRAAVQSAETHPAADWDTQNTVELAGCEAIQAAYVVAEPPARERGGEIE